MKTLNNRIIKFRFWSPKFKKMIYTHYNEDICNSSDWMVMQYTGLNDKNGHEIYEGDIIQYQYPESGNNKVEVRWSQPNENNHPGFRLFDSYGQYGNIEIISNFFEKNN